MDTTYVTMIISKSRQLGAKINYVGMTGYSPLITATLDHNVIAIRALLFDECDINKPLVKTYSAPQSFMSKRKGLQVLLILF